MSQDSLRPARLLGLAALFALGLGCFWVMRPFISALLWAVILGWLFFGDVPGLRILVGAAIVVLAGLFIFHRQSVKSTVEPEDVPKGVNT